MYLLLHRIYLLNNLINNLFILLSIASVGTCARKLFFAFIIIIIIIIIMVIFKCYFSGELIALS